MAARGPQRHGTPLYGAAVTGKAGSELLAICQRLTESDARAIRYHQGHAGTLALEAMTSRGHVIVKAHRSTERHHQELHAYTHWTTSLGSQAPSLVAATEDPPAIVITAIAGQSLTVASLNRREEQRAFCQAGQLLSAFHDAAPSHTESGMSSWLAHRGEQWLSLAHDVLPAAQQRDIRTHLAEFADLGSIPSVPCHLDYMPRNLLWTGERLHVIDYEHARYDLAARDLVRLHRRVFSRRPDLKAAFCDGYGSLTSEDHQVIEHCSYLDQLTEAVRSAGRALPHRRRSNGQ